MGTPVTYALFPATPRNQAFPVLSRGLRMLGKGTNGQPAKPSKKRQYLSTQELLGSDGIRSGQPKRSHASTMPMRSAKSMKPG